RPGWSLAGPSGFRVTTRSAPFRWLRNILLVAQPPLLTRRGLMAPGDFICKAVAALDDAFRLVQKLLLFPHPHHDHRAIVMWADASDKVGEGGADGLHDFFWSLLVIAAHGFGKAFQTELLARVVAHLNHAVRVEKEHVAGLKRQGHFLIRGIR